MFLVKAERMMIHLTRLNNQSFAVNSDLVQFVEQAPDTVITLLNGEKIIVREDTDEVVRRIVEFRRRVLQGMLQAWDYVPARPPLPKPEEGTSEKR